MKPYVCRKSTREAKIIRKLVVLLLLVAVCVGLLWLYVGRTGGTELEQWIGRQIVGMLESHLEPRIEFDRIDYQAPKTVVVDRLAFVSSRERIMSIERILLTLAEIPHLIDFFFVEELQYDSTLLLNKIETTKATQSLQAAIDKLEGLSNWTTDSLESILRPLASELELKTGVFFGILRVAVTGRTAAPPLFQTVDWLHRHTPSRIYLCLGDNNYRLQLKKL